MSAKNKKPAIGKVETLISQDTLVEGHIEAVGTLRIDGTVKGGIKKAEGVIIGETGTIEGNINAEVVSLSGRVIGNITSQSSLELMKGSTLKGDIVTEKLTIAEGAHFDGSCEMTGPGKESKSSDKEREPARVQAHAGNRQPAEEPT